MDKRVKQTSFGGRLWRGIAKAILFILLFILVIALLIETPPVQNLLRNKAVAWLEKKLETKVSVGRVKLSIPGNKFLLKDVYIEDRNHDTLLAGGSLDADVNFFHLAFTGELDIKKLALSNITLRANREKADSVFNYQFFINAFSNKKAKTSKDTSSFYIGIPSLELDKVRLVYYDEHNGSDVEAWIEHLDARINRYDPARLVIDIPRINIDGMVAKVYQAKKLATPDPMSKEIIEASKPNPLQLAFEEVALQNVNIDYRNDVSAVFTNLDIDFMRLLPTAIDMVNRRIELDSFALHNSTVAFRFGKKEAAKEIKKEIEQELESRTAAGWSFRLGSLDLENNKLLFDNENRQQLRSGMDYAHLDADSLTLKVNNLVMVKDSVSGIITEASFREQSGFILEELRTQFLYSDTATFLKELYLKTPGSELKRSASLNYASFEQLTKDFPSVRMEADIAESYLKVKDILVFAPALASQAAFSNREDTWFIDLQGSGTLQSLYIENLQFDGLKNTQVDAEGSLAISAPSQSGGRLTIRKLHTTQTDIALFTGKRLSNARLNLPEEFDANGTIAGGIDHLSTNLNISTAMGSAHIDGEFHHLSDPQQASYTAMVRTSSIQLGTILRNTQFGTLSANLAITGKGFDINSFDTRFRGDVQAFRFNDYTYRNIQLNGNIVKSNYSINTSIRDPNLSLSGTASGDISSTASFRFNGFIDSVKTLPLGLTNKVLVLRGKVEANLPIIRPDRLEADILVTKALIVTSENRLPLDSIRLLAGRNDTAAQYINLDSDVGHARIWGDYRYTDLGKIFTNSIAPYFTLASSSNNTITHSYHVNFNIGMNYSPVLSAFIPGLRSFESIQASGYASDVSGLNAHVTTPYIHYLGNEISGLVLDIKTGVNGLEFSADMRRLKTGTTLDIHHTRLNGIANNNKIDFNLQVDDASGRAKYNLAGLLDQPGRGIYVLSFKPGSLLLNYEQWTVNPGNSITITQDNVLANNFSLQKGDQLIILNTIARQLNVQFRNFHLATITGFLRSDSLLINGSMNGTIVFKNLKKNPVFTSDLLINDLSMRGDTIGNAAIKVDNLSGDRYNTIATITGRGNDISLTGSFAPLGEKDIALNLDLAIRQMQLATMEGALGNFLQNASGSIHGNVSIRGSASRPQISGPISFDNASFAISILGSQFKVDNQQLNVTENGFLFDNFLIRDSANNALVLNGAIQTPNFINYSFDLDVSADHFKILSTTKKKGMIYWGDLVITSEMHIEGTDTRPMVDGNVIVNEGTNLSLLLPQREPGVIEREGIVLFTDLDTPENDTLFKQYDSLNIADVKGMNITANIEIQKEAIFNIIIDAANGDFINMQGEGQLSTGIDPSGKITLVGNYELERGAYEITFNFLRRRFDIQKGSRITWLNEPTRATLDINAVYIANTAPIDLVQSQIAASTAAIRNTYMQKLPFEVRLHMTGELMQPKVEFDIVLPENRNYGVSNEIITQVDSRLQQIRQDQGEINKQVFALLLLGRFVGENPFASNAPLFDASTYARQSVSRLLTGQLNRLAEGLIDGVDINFDISSTDDYTTGERRRRTDLDIGLSKRLLNERLTVSVGSNFELEGPKNSGQKGSNFLGNVSVNYAISRDGRYMIRFYRKNEYQGIVDGYIIESGLSFLITVDFDKFSELLRSRKQRVKGSSR